MSPTCENSMGKLGSNHLFDLPINLSIHGPSPTWVSTFSWQQPEKITEQNIKFKICMSPTIFIGLPSLFLNWLKAFQ